LQHKQEVWRGCLAFIREKQGAAALSPELLALAVIRQMGEDDAG